MSAELKAGVFVLAAISALVYMTTRLTQNRYTLSGTKKYYALISDATGLLSKSKVKMSGLDVGQLKNMELAGNKKVRVTIEVAADMNLYKDATIAVKSIGFLGDKYLELHPGAQSAGVLEEGGYIAEGDDGGSIDSLTRKTGELVDNLKDIALVLKDALKGAGTDGDGTRLDRILDNMEQFSEGLAEIDKLGHLADRFSEIADNVRDITARVNRGEGTVGKLLTDSETIDKINQTISGVNKLVTKVDKLQVIVDAKSAALVARGGSRSNFSVMIQPTYDKYYLFGITTRPQGITTIKRTETTPNPDQPGAVSSVTETKETEEAGIGINAQFAKRFGDAVFKFGLFESTGGLGIDYNLLDDRAKIFGEVYRFRSGNSPQVNFGAEVQVYRPFYIWTGVDFLLTSVNRSYFVGGGIRFTDQDLKALIATAASSGSLR
ncbi:MAG: MlaD family protein [Bdellovibrionota bacterium]